MRGIIAWASCMWLTAAYAEPTPAPKTPLPDAELLEFLGSFETKTGQWPELVEALAKKPAPKKPATLPPKEEAKR